MAATLSLDITTVPLPPQPPPTMMVQRLETHRVSSLHTSTPCHCDTIKVPTTTTEQQEMDTTHSTHSGPPQVSNFGFYYLHV